MKSLSIHAASMFDGFTLSGPATVYIVGDRIVRVDRTGALPVDGTEVIDLGPQSCLLPGLIDSHVHLAFDAGPDPVAALIATDDTDLLAHMRSAARSLLQAGITTVRDLGDRNYLSVTLAEELASRPELGPEILPAGPPLTTKGGHCHFFGGEVEGVEALRSAVREHHARGCAVIKIMVSGGFMTPGAAPPYESQYGLAELRAVVDEAHRLGLPVAAHSHGTQAIRDALEAGVDSLEHATFLTADGVDSAPDVIKAVAGSDTFVSLTLGLDPRYEAPTGIGGRTREQMRAKMRELHELGAKVVIGSDAGIGPAKPHDVLPHGVGDLARLGVTPVDALISVTSRAARLCHVEGRKGRLAAGADADLLVVGGNPVEDPAALLDVRAVFRAGTRVR